MSKPSVVKLSGDSFKFVFANMRTFRAHLKFVLPFILTFILINQACNTYDIANLQAFIIIPWLFALSFFTLSWHQVSLIGPDISRAVTPFTLRADDWRFTGLYVIMTGALTLVVKSIQYVSTAILPPYGEDIVFAGDIASFVILSIAIYFYIRSSFLLPAKSQGVTLSLKDAMRASKGLFWPIFATVIIILLILLVTIIFYFLINYMVIGVSTGERAIEPMRATIVSFILSVPLVIAIFLCMAVYTTALSLAYQWGMQNNPV